MPKRGYDLDPTPRMPMGFPCFWCGKPSAKCASANKSRPVKDRCCVRCRGKRSH